MPRSILKKWIYTSSLILLTLFVSERLFCRFLFQQTQSEPCWEISYTSQQLEATRSILMQPLHFLGMGSQCLAFASEDNQHVIKICKAPRYKKLTKKTADFSSYLLAFQLLPKQSEMLFLHLNATDTLHTSLKIVDPLGIPHFLEADRVTFYIQKKLLPFFEYVQPSLPTLTDSEAKNLIDALLELCIETCKLPLKIRDIQLKNIGINHPKCIWMDPGRISKKQEPVSFEEQKKEFSRLVFHLRPCLIALHPKFEPILEEEFLKRLELMKS